MPSAAAAWAGARPGARAPSQMAARGVGRRRRRQAGGTLTAEPRRSTRPSCPPSRFAAAGTLVGDPSLRIDSLLNCPPPGCRCRCRRGFAGAGCARPAFRGAAGSPPVVDLAQRCPRPLLDPHGGRPRAGAARGRPRRAWRPREVSWRGRCDDVVGDPALPVAHWLVWGCVRARAAELGLGHGGGGGEGGRVVVLWNECAQQFGPNRFLSRLFSPSKTGTAVVSPQKRSATWEPLPSPA